MSKQKAAADSSQPQSPSNVPIVAIGASAGGQEAVVELLKNLSPTTGLAYVYIQHLDPTLESHLSDILGRATSMIVQEAQHLMRVEPNHLYIIPPDRDLEVLDGVLTLVPRKARSVIHMPVDQFFLSLAERQKEGAIAVVLSGTASDGTLGLRAIKAAGELRLRRMKPPGFRVCPGRPLRRALWIGCCHLPKSPKNSND
ncbi:chemotaxis protein CheB [Spirosoma sp. KNUC1025]|nr:chemotaxis protein CheB [Spirosoma sp. KNUC1025]